MYSGICSVVRVNGHLSEPFEITRSVRQGCPLSSLLYVLTLEPLLRKLEVLRGIPFELGRGRAVSAYADDVTVMVSDTTEVEVVGTVLKEYEAVTRAKINFPPGRALYMNAFPPIQTYALAIRSAS